MIHLDSLKLALVEVPTYTGIRTEPLKLLLFHFILPSAILPIFRIGNYGQRLVPATNRKGQSWDPEPG